MLQGKVFQNAKWIVVCKVIQSLIQLLIGMVSARYLGPSNYGLINYAASVVAFSVPIMQLGLGETLVREYVAYEGEEGKVLGTSLVLNLASSVACIVGVTCFAAIANPGDWETVLVCALYSLNLTFQAVEMTKYWFQSKLLSKFSSLAMLTAHIVVSLYKVYLLVNGKSVYWFALSHSVEYGAAALILLVTYWRLSGQRIEFSAQIAGAIFRRSRYYILANLMVTVFQNTGPVVLKLVSGDTENGYYAAAVTCCIIFAFVYMAIIDSVRPVILESKQKSQSQFERNISRIYGAVIYLTLAQSLVFTLLAKLIVVVLYGREYLSAAPILQILIWQTPFSYMGTVRNIWMLAEEKHQALWKINMIGAIFNIAVNAILIPLWGACGAALASVLTQFFTNFVMGFIYKPIRENNRLLLKGLDPRLLFEMAKMLKSRLQDG